MKIYVDLVLFLNFGFDFVLLLTVSYLLKRKTPIFRLLLGAFFGSLSILILFFEVNSFTLFLIKVLISIGMILISFGFRDRQYFIKNMFYLYMASILLGGFLYFLNMQFSYKNEGLVFYHHGLGINIWFLMIVSPVILFIYVKQNKNLKKNYCHYHRVIIYLQDKVIECIGYLDTGNQLVDPYFHRSILLLNQNMVSDQSAFHILVPYYTVGNQGLLYCTNPTKIEVDGLEYKVLVGISQENIQIDGVDCILPNIIEEGIC